jgi:hypothetical protein
MTRPLERNTRKALAERTSVTLDYNSQVKLAQLTDWLELPQGKSAAVRRLILFAWTQERTRRAAC